MRIRISSKGPIVFTYVLFWGSEALEHFKDLEALSNFFFASKCFIPRREIRSISLGVQLILFPFIGVSKSLEPFKNLKGFSIIFLPQNVLFDGLDGWTGGTVTKSVLDFFSF